MVPIVRLNHSSSDFSVQVGFSLKNYDWYEVEIHRAECTLVIDGMMVATLGDERILTLKPNGAALEFAMLGHLTPGDVKRVEFAFSDQRTKVARCGIRFSIKTRFGTGTLDLLEKIYCIQLERYGS